MEGYKEHWEGQEDGIGTSQHAVGRPRERRARAQAKDDLMVPDPDRASARTILTEESEGDEQEAGEKQEPTAH